MVIGGGAYLNGGFARLFFPQGLPAGGDDAVVPEMLIRAGFPGVMLGLIMVLLLSASMSTLSALALSSSSAVAIDAYKGYINPNAKEKKSKADFADIMFVVHNAERRTGNIQSGCYSNADVFQLGHIGGLFHGTLCAGALQ